MYSTNVLAIIGRRLVEHLPSVIPSSLLGKALQYMSGQYPTLLRYIGDGNWPISYNVCENEIRPFVVDRKGSCSPMPSPTRRPVPTCTRSWRGTRRTVSSSIAI